MNNRDTSLAWDDKPSVIWLLRAAALLVTFGSTFAGYRLVMGFSAVSLRIAVLPRLLVLGLHASALLLVVGFLWEGKNLIRPLLGMNRRPRWILMGLCVGAVLFVFFQVPRVNRVLFDEHIYQNIAQSIIGLGESVMCNEGSAEFGEYICDARELNKQPNAHPYYLALFFRVFGTHEWAGHLANNAALALAMLSIAAIALRLFQSERVALYAAALYAATPMVLRWSNSVASEPATAAFGTLAVLTGLHHFERRTWSSLALCTGALSFALQFRYEAVLLLAPVGLYFLLRGPRSIFAPRVVLVVPLLSVLLLPLALQLYAFKDYDWGSNGDKFGFHVLQKNFVDNSLFYLQNEYFPLVFTVFIAAGIVFGRPRKAIIVVMAWALCLWGVFLFFYAGSYKYGVDVRYSVVSAVPLALLAAVGADRFEAQLDRWAPSRARVTVLLLFVVCWLPFVPVIRLIGQESCDGRYDVEFAREMASRIPPDGFVLTHQPSMWLVLGKNAAQTSLALTNESYLRNNIGTRYSGGVFFHWNYWCSVEDYSGFSPARFCNEVINRYNVQLLHESKRYRHTYRLYRVNTEQRYFPTPSFKSQGSDS